mmetsp:Transcript_11800/g.29488  ORF Transcript_11800/g.29488 Transcript_11800/m.29488 type:complete len:232 (+) Transcript_11800:2393-3088(+)
MLGRGGHSQRGVERQATVRVFGFGGLFDGCRKSRLPTVLLLPGGSVGGGTVVLVRLAEPGVDVPVHVEHFCLEVVILFCSKLSDSVHLFVEGRHSSGELVYDLPKQAGVDGRLVVLVPGVGGGGGASGRALLSSPNFGDGLFSFVVAAIRVGCGGSRGPLLASRSGGEGLSLSSFAAGGGSSGGVGRGGVRLSLPILKEGLSLLKLSRSVVFRGGHVEVRLLVRSQSKAVA